MTLTKLNGNESGVIIAKLINALIDEKASIDLSDLDATGEQRFTDLSTAISTLNTALSTLTTTVNKKVEATVSLAANGYIKFDNKITICYGTLTATGRQTVTTNFPITFATACRAVSLEHTYASSTTIGDGVSLKIILSGTPTKSSFTWKTSGEGSNFYIAIGY